MENTERERERMPQKRLDLIGKRFGKLIVVSYFGKKGRYINWNTKCDCGGEKVVSRGHLRSGRTKSCGCINKLMMTKRMTIHGNYYTPSYRIWKSMISRCTYPTNISYKNYGGRGITVCNRWMDSFKNFYHDMGDVPRNMTLERVDNNKNYNPDNCKWATDKEQANNRRSNNILSYNGRSMNISQWAIVLNIKRKTLSWRIHNGWSIQRAFATL